MSNTIYKDIPGFPGYRVGSDGTVWRLWVTCRSGRKLTDTWRPMKLSPGHKGYLRVNLVPPDGGSYQTFRVHRLVLEAFVGPCPDGMECRHFPDTDKANNRLDNLSWGTAKENRNDNHTTDAYGRGESHTQSVLTDDRVQAIRSRRAAGESLKSLAAAFGVSAATVSMIANRRIWKHV
jgi:hypothetical protein